MTRRRLYVAPSVAAVRSIGFNHYSEPDSDGRRALFNVTKCEACFATLTDVNSVFSPSSEETLKAAGMTLAVKPFHEPTCSDDGGYCCTGCYKPTDDETPRGTFGVPS